MPQGDIIYYFHGILFTLQRGVHVLLRSSSAWRREKIRQDLSLEESAESSGGAGEGCMWKKQSRAERVLRGCQH